MYPERLPMEPRKHYWANEDCFTSDPEHLTSAFPHINYQIGMHAHEFYEVNIVLSGTGCHYIEESFLPIWAGNVFIIPPKILHGYYCQENLNVFHILIHPEFMKRYSRELTSIPGYSLLFEIEPYLRQVYPKNLFLELNYDEVTKLEPETKRLHRLDKSGHYVSENIAVLNLLSTFCLRIYEAQTAEDPEFGKTDQDILRALEFIHNNLEAKLTVARLLQIASMSGSTFNRHFRSMVHVSPTEYILWCRIRKARALIEEGRHNRTEIAQMCGFYDISHMNKYLKEIKV